MGLSGGRDSHFGEDSSRSPNVNNPRARTEGREGVVRLETIVVALRMGWVCVRKSEGIRDTVSLASRRLTTNA